ncbi:hypothetical protein ABVT39_020518 [Epinephelus coioides]
MPSDAFQIKALAQLVSYFGWTWVGVIGLESDYARFAIQLFLQESVQYGVCSAFTHFYPVVLSQQALDELLDVIQVSSSKVIINFSSALEMEVILREIRCRNITGLQWIASEAWATASSLWEKFGDLLTGTLGFAIRRADVIPGLKQHLAGLRPSNIHESAILTEFWEELFNCRLNGSLNDHSHGGDNYHDRLLCNGTENLNDVYSPYYDVTQLRVSYNVYKAVYVVAHALQDMSNCLIGQGPFLNGACADPKTVKPWQLMHYMKHVNFSVLSEKVNFDQNGDPIAYYDLLNWQRRPDGSLHLVKVGFYDASSPGRSLVINDSVIQWPVGKQVCFLQTGLRPCSPLRLLFSSRALRWMQTMTFAIKEINQRSDLLPQLKLGFHICDSSSDIPVSLRASLLLVNGQPEIGTRVNRDKGLRRNSTSNLGCAATQNTVSPVIIGDATSGMSMAVLRSLGSFHIPLVSYFASCSCLSNQREFPTFMRTMPSDAFQIKALAQLVSYFGWTWVGVIGIESDYARFAIQFFLQESVLYGVCAAFTHFYPVVLSQQALDKLLDVIQMEVILREIRCRNITGLQWIASEAWATSSSLWEKFGDLLTGTLGFAIRRADVIPGLKQHLAGLRPSNIHESTILTEFWEELFNCRLNGSMNDHSHGGDNYLDRLPCNGTENLNDVYSPYYDVTQLRVSYNVYKAVYVVAHALQDMSNCIIGQGPFLNGACADPKTVKPWQVRLLMHYMNCLSNQREFPTFMRTMPSDAFQIKALAQLVSYFGWTWVGVIGMESDYARFAIQLFLQESVQYGVCTAYTHFYPVALHQQALNELLDVIQMSSSKVIINFSSESEMEVILREIRRWNITGLQWIASEAWASARSLWEKFGDLLTGTLGFAIRRADVIPGLKQHLAGLRPSNIHESAILTEFWEELFNCRLNGSMNDHSHGGDNYLDRLPCKGTENLNDVYSPYYDVTQLRVSYNVYKAVYVVAHALQDMSNCIFGQGPFLNGACADPKTVKPWQLIHYMKHVNFSVLGEKVNFDQNGDPIAYYDLLNWQRRPDGSLHLVKVGFYDASSPGRSLVINDSVIQWPVGKQVCFLQTGLRPCSPLRLLYVLLINTSANLFLIVCNILFC